MKKQPKPNKDSHHSTADLAVSDQDDPAMKLVVRVATSRGTLIVPTSRLIVFSGLLFEINKRLSNQIPADQTDESAWKAVALRTTKGDFLDLSDTVDILLMIEPEQTPSLIALTYSENIEHPPDKFEFFDSERNDSVGELRGAQAFESRITKKPNDESKINLKLNSADIDIITSKLEPINSNRSSLARSISSSATGSPTQTNLITSPADQITLADPSHIAELKSETVFISYCWMNSVRAEQERAIGSCDPRDVKDFLSSKGFTTWIDFEQIIGGVPLFRTLADGILNASVVVACISDEYASSYNCVREFYFAKDICRLPIIPIVVGTGWNWKKTEIGFLSSEHIYVDCTKGDISSSLEKVVSSLVSTLRLKKSSLPSLKPISSSSSIIINQISQTNLPYIYQPKILNRLEDIQKLDMVECLRQRNDPSSKYLFMGLHWQPVQVLDIQNSSNKLSINTSSSLIPGQNSTKMFLVRFRQKQPGKLNNIITNDQSEWVSEDFIRTTPNSMHSRDELSPGDAIEFRYYSFRAEEKRLDSHVSVSSKFGSQDNLKESVYSDEDEIQTIVDDSYDWWPAIMIATVTDFQMLRYADGLNRLSTGDIPGIVRPKNHRRLKAGHDKKFIRTLQALISGELIVTETGGFILPSARARGNSPSYIKKRTPLMEFRSLHPLISDFYLPYHPTKRDGQSPRIFFSYSWSNSKGAMNTYPHEIRNKANYGQDIIDPRDIAKFLEESGGLQIAIDYKTMDVDNLLGGTPTENDLEFYECQLRNEMVKASAAIICVSLEYAKSSLRMRGLTYMRDILKIPIFMLLVGKTDSRANTKILFNAVNAPYIDCTNPDLIQSRLTRLAATIRRQFQNSVDIETGGDVNLSIWSNSSLFAHGGIVPNPESPPLRVSRLLTRPLITSFDFSWEISKIQKGDTVECLEVVKVEIQDKNGAMGTIAGFSWVPYLVEFAKPSKDSVATLKKIFPSRSTSEDRPPHATAKALPINDLIHVRSHFGAWRVTDQGWQSDEAYRSGWRPAQYIRLPRYPTPIQVLELNDAISIGDLVEVRLPHKRLLTWFFDNLRTGEYSYVWFPAIIETISENNVEFGVKLLVISGSEIDRCDVSIAQIRKVKPGIPYIVSDSKNLDKFWERDDRLWTWYSRDLFVFDDGNIILKDGSFDISREINKIDDLFLSEDSTQSNAFGSLSLVTRKQEGNLVVLGFSKAWRVQISKINFAYRTIENLKFEGGITFSVLDENGMELETSDNGDMTGSDGTQIQVGFLLKYTPRCATARFPFCGLKSDIQLYYFEVFIENIPSTDTCVSFGLVGEQYPAYLMVGYQNFSCGLHSLHGRLISNGHTISFTRPFGNNDTIGVGFDAVENNIFFTLNGHYLGFFNVGGKLKKNIDYDNSSLALFPAVSADGPATIKINYGGFIPFVYNPANEWVESWKNIGDLISDVSSSNSDEEQIVTGIYGDYFTDVDEITSNSDSNLIFENGNAGYDMNLMVELMSRNDSFRKHFRRSYTQ
ncbi:Leucine-rich repeat serine/threonine-protein kinase 2 [Nowakowskiella sp. JEL0078]|nr:Leucine-rich repeat serine/threonine-protein kinase 2 [Nowakowskiella sp. JEL0078]